MEALHCGVRVKYSLHVEDYAPKCASCNRISDAPRGETAYQVKLTEDIVRALRAQSSNLNNAQTARNYGVSESTIRDAVVGRTWKHVTDD